MLTRTNAWQAGNAGIYVPHGHHENLHVRPSAPGSSKPNRIDYDLSLNLLTMRTPRDFGTAEGPQVDFLEDHVRCRFCLLSHPLVLLLRADLWSCVAV